MNENTFEMIFWTVGEELGINEWWVLFDSGDMDEVERRIAEAFGVEDATEIEGFIEWYNNMAMEL